MGKEARCKKRCDAEFALKPELRDGCRAYCKTANSSFIDGFLRTIKEEDIIRRYGYDPNPTGGISIEQYVDPLNERALRERQMQEQGDTFKKILIGGGVLVALALLVFLFIKRK